MILRRGRLCVVLSLLLVAGVLLMHAWTGANGQHLTSPGGPHQAAPGHVAQGQPIAGEPTAAAVVTAAHMPGGHMVGCAAILLLLVALALPGIVGPKRRLWKASRWPSRSTSASGPPPDLTVRLCVLRT